MIDFGFCNEGGGVERGFGVTGFFIKRGPIFKFDVPDFFRVTEFRTVTGPEIYTI